MWQSGTRSVRKRVWLPSTAGGGLRSGTHVCLRSGRGLWAEADDGRAYLDANSGLWHLSLGYGPARVAEAVRKAAITLGGTSLFRRSHVWADELAERLVDAVRPDGDGYVFYSTSGSEASDAVMRISFAYHRRSPRDTIAFVRGAYHGVSLGPLSLMGLDGYRNGAPMVVSTVALPSYASWTKDEESSSSQLREAFREVGGRLAAVFFEPIQGSGGVVRMPDNYATAISNLAKEQGALLVADEVACGVFRVGDFAAHTSYNGLDPDIVLLGKGLTGGVTALSAVVVKDAIVDDLIDDPATNRLPGTTHSGNPLACAAALATLEALYEPESVKLRQSTAEAMNEWIPQLLTLDGVDAVRGWGHMWGVQLHRNIIANVNEHGWVIKTMQHGLAHGLLIHPLSIGVIPIFPALVAIEDEIEQIIFRLSAVINGLTEGKGP